MPSFPHSSFLSNLSQIKHLWMFQRQALKCANWAFVSHWLPAYSLWKCFHIHSTPRIGLAFCARWSHFRCRYFRFWTWVGFLLGRFLVWHAHLHLRKLHGGHFHANVEASPASLPLPLVVIVWYLFDLVMSSALTYLTSSFSRNCFDGIYYGLCWFLFSCPFTSFRLYMTVV